MSKSNPHWDSLRSTYNDEASSLANKGRTWRQTQTRLNLNQMLNNEIKALRSECKAVDKHFVNRDNAYKVHFQAARQIVSRISQIVKSLDAEHKRAVILEEGSPHPDGLPQEFEVSS